MAQVEEQRRRIGILWRGDRDDPSPAPRLDRQLAPLLDAFGKLPVTIVPVPFADDAGPEVLGQLLTCDGVLVWVNPIQDGANRATVDAILRQASAAGVWVSAHPDVILKLGTKEILFQTRDLGWGSDTDLYRTLEDFEGRFPNRLAHHRRLVVKQGRGNGGDGVLKVELIEQNETPVGPNTMVRVQDAQTRDGSSEQISLGTFISRCETYFSWSGCLVDQEYQERLTDGMIRCYFSRDKVVGFCHQWPRGLLDFDPDDGSTAASSAPTVMEGPDIPVYQKLRELAETEWVPRMMDVLNIDSASLPAIWDADFLHGPKDRSGEDTYVLCEINASAVWPFPPMASETVAQATLSGILAAERNWN